MPSSRLGYVDRVLPIYRGKSWAENHLLASVRRQLERGTPDELDLRRIADRIWRTAYAKAITDTRRVLLDVLESAEAKRDRRRE